MSRFFVHRVRAAAMVAAAVLLGATLALSPRPACAAEPDALSFVPKGTAVVITIRPAALLSDDTLGPVLNGLLASVPMEKEVGITPQQISRATVAFKVMEPEPVGLGVVETTEDVDWSAVLKRIAPTAEATKFGDYTGAADEQRKFYAAVIGPRMAIVGNSDVLLEDAIERSQAPGKSQEWLKPLLGNDADVLIAAGFDHAPIAPLVENALRTKGSPENVIAAAMFEPLWKDVKSTTAKFKFKPKLQLEIVATCSSPEAAPEVKKTLDAVTVLSTNMARGYLDLAPRGRTPEEKLQRTAVKYGQRIGEALTTTVDGATVTIATSLDVAPGELVATVMQATEAAQASAARMNAMNNVKQIMLAMHNYADVHGRFPAAVMMGPDGKTPHSWRVAILPYLEQQALYNEYKFDEPWDSDANKRVMSAIPAIYATPGPAAAGLNTRFFACTGPTSIMGSAMGSRFADITDGTSQTIMVVEAHREIPWTKPEDIPFDPEQPLPKLGGFTEGKVLVGFADGAVRLLPINLAAEKLRALVSKNGGEVIDFDF